MNKQIFSQLALQATFVLAFIMSSNSMAATRSVILPTAEQGLVIVQRFDRHTGAVDKDPDTLMELMKVATKEAPSGDKGKIIETADRSFVITCVQRTSTGTLQCQFVVNASPNSLIDAAHGQLAFVATGGVASQLYQKFEHSPGQVLEYSTSDGLLSLRLSADQVQFEYSAD